MKDPESGGNRVFLRECIRNLNGYRVESDKQEFIIRTLCVFDVILHTLYKRSSDVVRFIDLVRVTYVLHRFPKVL